MIVRPESSSPVPRQTPRPVLDSAARARRQLLSTAGWSAIREIEASSNARPTPIPAHEVAGDCRTLAADFLPFFPMNSKDAMGL
jgi:hypothetical protein